MSRTLKVGDKVTYRSLSGALRIGTVDFVSQDIKDGRAGFDLETGVWGYAADVENINGRPVRGCAVDADDFSDEDYEDYD